MRIAMVNIKCSINIKCSRGVIVFACFWLFGAVTEVSLAQTPISRKRKAENRDSLYIQHVEDSAEPDKVLHAEPLYIDLIRDLGARRGENEINIGVGMQDNVRYDSYQVLAEYEFAPINRLGLGVEIPFTFYRSLRNKGDYLQDSLRPRSRLNSLKVAAQYSFFVNEKIKTSMAIGYIHEFEIHSFYRLRKGGTFKGNLFNPFFVIAKRWGDRFHTMLYTGPRIDNRYGSQKWKFEYEMHLNLHYMIPGTRNFIGMEVNNYFATRQANVCFRPQMRLAISHNFLIGIVAQIPANRNVDGLGLYTRLMYEPPHLFARQHGTHPKPRPVAEPG